MTHERCYASVVDITRPRQQRKRHREPGSYPLEVRASVEGWWTKGHHDAGMFAAAVGRIERVWRRSPPRTLLVYTAHWRYVHGDLVTCTPGKRGCFPVTYAEK